MMPSVNLFLIGAAKAGTTSLASLLAQHPDIAMARSKEPHFFSYDHRYSRGLADYAREWSWALPSRVVADASTSYSRIRRHPEVIRRIQAVAPAAKIIYMVRHPIQRMESAYVEHLCTATSPPFASINDAIRREPMIVDSSRYWEVYSAYRFAFSASNVLVVWFEEYVVDQLSVFQSTCRFLGIDDRFTPDLRRQRLNGRSEARARMERIGRSGLRVDLCWEPSLKRSVIASIEQDTRQLLQHWNRSPDYWVM